MKIYELLKHYREKAELTQAQVANAMGSVHHAAYQTYESGNTEPTVPQLERILQAMGYEMSILITPEPLTPLQIRFIDECIQNKEFTTGENKKGKRT